MVVISFKGGLGNQLFQFAFGKRIALDRNEQLYFNLKPLIKNKEKATPRDWKLDGLPDTIIAEEEHANAFNDIYFGERKAEIISDETPKGKISDIINDPNIKAILIDGYFQDEFYFEPCKELISQQIKTLLNKYYKEAQVSDNLLPVGDQTVSVHVRRTDYLEPAKLLVHGICDIDYYQQAIETIESKLIEPQYYLFSDDPAEADKLLTGILPNKTNISSVLSQVPSKHNDLVELYLMTQCKNFILANSSFSWWGSYLSEAEDKIVIAPEKWLLSEELQSRADDIALPSWIRV